MAPFRASRSTRSDRRTGTHAEADVFDGLPVRQWRLHESIVAPTPSLDNLEPGFGANVPPGHAPMSHQQQLQQQQQQQRAMRLYNKWTTELPMPKGSELYAPWCQQLLRAARAGRIRKRCDDDSGPQTRDEEKDNGEDGENAQQTELKGFVARRWTPLPRQTERPEVEYLAKRRKGLSSVIPLAGMPGMVGSDGQGAAAEGALNQPVVEERKRNMPPRRKPKKGVKKKKMSDGAGLGVSASAEALAASNAPDAAAEKAAPNGAAAKVEGDDVTMQDVDDGDEEGEEGESGEDDGDEDGDESEMTPQPSDRATTAPRSAEPTEEPAPRPQHPLATETSATEISATEAMAEPTRDDPQAPPSPIKQETTPAPATSIPKLEHDLVPELTDEPRKDDSIRTSEDHLDVKDDETRAAREASAVADAANVPAASHPISAAELQAVLVPTAQPSAVEETPIETADLPPRNSLVAEAMEQDEAARRDADMQDVPSELGPADSADAAVKVEPTIEAAEVPPPEAIGDAGPEPPVEGAASVSQEAAAASASQADQIMTEAEDLDAASTSVPAPAALYDAAPALSASITEETPVTDTAEPPLPAVAAAPAPPPIPAPAEPSPIQKDDEAASASPAAPEASADTPAATITSSVAPIAATFGDSPLPAASTGQGDAEQADVEQCDVQQSNVEQAGAEQAMTEQADVDQADENQAADDDAAPVAPAAEPDAVEPVAVGNSATDAAEPVVAYTAAAEPVADQISADDAGAVAGADAGAGAGAGAGADAGADKATVDDAVTNTGDPPEENQQAEEDKKQEEDALPPPDVSDAAAAS